MIVAGARRDEFFTRTQDGWDWVPANLCGDEVSVQRPEIRAREMIKRALAKDGSGLPGKCPVVNRRCGRGHQPKVNASVVKGKSASRRLKGGSGESESLEEGTESATCGASSLEHIIVDVGDDLFVVTKDDGLVEVQEHRTRDRKKRVVSELVRFQNNHGKITWLVVLDDGRRVTMAHNELKRCNMPLFLEWSARFLSL